jgi:hypothetical protein
MGRAWFPHDSSGAASWRSILSLRRHVGRAPASLLSRFAAQSLSRLVAQSLSHSGRAGQRAGQFGREFSAPLPCWSRMFPIGAVGRWLLPGLRAAPRR